MRILLFFWVKCGSNGSAQGLKIMAYSKTRHNPKCVFLSLDTVILSVASERDLCSVSLSSETPEILDGSSSIRAGSQTSVTCQADEPSEVSEGSCLSFKTAAVSRWDPEGSKINVTARQGGDLQIFRSGYRCIAETRTQIKHFHPRVVPMGISCFHVQFFRTQISLLVHTDTAHIRL